MKRLLIAALLALPAGAQSADTYQIVFLRPSPDRKTLPKEEGERLQSSHMANIRSMSQRGILVAAGPFGDTPQTISGIFVMKTASLDEALRIAAEDPTVVAHRNTVDGVTWTGPKGVGEEHRRLQAGDPKMSPDMGVHPLVLLRGKPNAAHDEYVARLRRERKVAAAGPLEGNGDLGALVIFQRIPDEEAKRLIDDDPAVKSGVLRVEFHHWWSAAHVLPE